MDSRVSDATDTPECCVCMREPPLPDTRCPQCTACLICRPCYTRIVSTTNRCPACRYEPLSPDREPRTRNPVRIMHQSGVISLVYMASLDDSDSDSSSDDSSSADDGSVSDDGSASAGVAQLLMAMANGASPATWFHLAEDDLADVVSELAQLLFGLINVPRTLRARFEDTLYAFVVLAYSRAGAGVGTAQDDIRARRIQQLADMVREGADIITASMGDDTATDADHPSAIPRASAVALSEAVVQHMFRAIDVPDDLKPHVARALHAVVECARRHANAAMADVPASAASPQSEPLVHILSTTNMCPACWREPPSPEPRTRDHRPAPQRRDIWEAVIFMFIYVMGAIWVVLSANNVSLAGIIGGWAIFWDCTTVIEMWERRDFPLSNIYIAFNLTGTFVFLSMLSLGITSVTETTALTMFPVLLRVLSGWYCKSLY